MTLPLRARLEHVFMLGATGSGKSRLLLHFMRQAVQLGEGLLFLDPHGNHPDSDFRSLLAWLKDRRPHIVDFSSSRVVGFNPLACPDGTDPSVVAGNVMDALAITWEGESFTQKPTIERNLSAIIAALVELKLTFCEAEYLLDHKDAHGLRRYAIEHIKEPSTLNELRRLSDLASDGRRKRDYDQEVIGSINRLARLLRSPVIRTMLGQTENCLDFRAAMDKGEIILANLSGGSQVYERDTDLFGRLLTRTALFHAKRRENTHPFSVVLDEAHRFLSSDIPVLLAEIRKYGVSIVAAMQWLEQAEDDILPALLNGTNCKVCFRLRDAEESEKVARTIVPLNLERPVAALIRPMTVGHRRIKLANESESEQESTTHTNTTVEGETVGESETDGHTIGSQHTRQRISSETESDNTNSSRSKWKRSEDEESGTETEGEGSSTSRTKGESIADGDSEAFTHSLTRQKSSQHSKAIGHGLSHGTGRSKGLSEALKPILEKLPSAVHSMQNELYAAGRMLRSLPTAVGFLSYVGKTGPVETLFTVPPIFTPQLPDEAFSELRDRLSENSKPLSEAQRAIIDREQWILSGAEPEVKPKRTAKPADADKNIERGSTW